MARCYAPPPPRWCVPSTVGLPHKPWGYAMGPCGTAELAPPLHSAPLSTHRRGAASVTDTALGRSSPCPPHGPPPCASPRAGDSPHHWDRPIVSQVVVDRRLQKSDGSMDERFEPKVCAPPPPPPAPALHSRHRVAFQRQMAAPQTDPFTHRTGPTSTRGQPHI